MWAGLMSLKCVEIRSFGISANKFQDLSGLQNISTFFAKKEAENSETMQTSINNNINVDNNDVNNNNDVNYNNNVNNNNHNNCDSDKKLSFVKIENNNLNDYYFCKECGNKIRKENEFNHNDFHFAQKG